MILPRIVIAGTNSSCGKTTVTLSVLQALKNRGMTPAVFKCGPDYIDPMFHKKILEVPSYNLDLYLCSEKVMRMLFCEECRGRELSVIEGVMGYYDGAGKEAAGSTYQIARSLETPVVLVINARGMQNSAGAVLSGFKNFRADSNIQGVIFNRTTERGYTVLKEIAEDAGMKPLGFLPDRAEYGLESRHLGLVTADEIRGIEEKIQLLGNAAENTIDLQGLLEIAASADEIGYENAVPLKPLGKELTVAVARDEAFCFLYEENLEILKKLGCRIVFFSPLHDSEIPPNADGLYLPGGYPELYEDQLSENHPMLNSIRAAVAGGMPTVAECGGFMFLHKSIDGRPMCGIIEGEAKRTDRLQRFGYAELTALKDNLLCRCGEQIKTHEFHYYESSSCGEDFISIKASNQAKNRCIHATENLFAGFPHIYFPANISFAHNFVKRMQDKKCC